MTSPRRALSALGLAGLLLTTAACGSGSSTDDESPQRGGSSSTSSSGGELSGTVTVYAAASLKKTFTEIGAEFEKAHPGVTVTFNFAGSSDLVAQLQQGAPADVFASADTKNMDKATGDSLTAATPVDFATNTLEIAVPAGNPARIASLADLARSGVKVVLCAPEVPCGSAAAMVEAAAKIDITPVSESPVALSMFLVSAEAKTSAGAPCWICATRSEEPAKLKVTVTPGCAFSNSAPISVNVFFSEAAA